MLAITLPAQLQAFAGGQKTIAVEAATLGEAFAALDRIAPMLRSQLVDSNGAVHQFVGLFLDNRQVLTLGDGRQPVPVGGHLVIIQAVAGG